MFILSDPKTGGIYAVQSKGLKKTVHIFEQEEDAQRYIDMLNAEDYKDELEILEVDTDIVAMNCNKYGYSYSLVLKNDLVIPPS